MSLLMGTNRTSRAGLTKSVDWGKAEVACRVVRTVFDPTVWTGRALQAESEKMEGVGLAHLYPALAWSVCAPGHHGYPRAPDLILGKALRGRLGHQITGTTARPFLHLLNSTRRPRRVFSFC